MNLTNSEILNKLQQINQDAVFLDDQNVLLDDLLSQDDVLNHIGLKILADNEIFEKLKPDFDSYLGLLGILDDGWSKNDYLIFQTYSCLYLEYNYIDFHWGFNCKTTQQVIQKYFAKSSNTFTDKKINLILGNFEKQIDEYILQINSFNNSLKQDYGHKIGGIGGVSYLDVSDKIEGQNIVYPIGLQKRINDLYYEFLNFQKQLNSADKNSWLNNKLKLMNQKFEKIIGKNIFEIYIKNRIIGMIKDEFVIVELTKIFKKFYTKSEELFNQSYVFFEYLSIIKLGDNEVLEIMLTLKNILVFLEKQEKYADNIFLRIINHSIGVLNPLELSEKIQITLDMKVGFKKLLDHLKDNQKSKNVFKHAQIEEPPVETLSKNAKTASDTLEAMFGEEVRGILGDI